MTRVDAIAGGIAPSPYAGLGPNVIRAIAGYAGKPVTLTVVNVGRATHMFTSTYLASQDLEVESADIEVDAPKGVKYVKVQPGKSAEIKFTPMQNGTFEFSCDVKSGGRSHRDRGMKGQLVVN